MMDFYLIARQLDVRFALHDDLWVSMYLQDARRVPIANVLSGNTCPAVGNVLGPWRDWSTALWNAQFDAQGNQNSSKGLSRVQLTFRLAQLRERLLSAYLAITAASSSNASSHCQLRTKTTSESTNGAAAAEAEMKAMELLQSPAANVLHSFSRTPSIWQALADYNTSIRFEDADQAKWLQDDAVYPASCECDGGVGSSPSCAVTIQLGARHASKCSPLSDASVKGKCKPLPAVKRVDAELWRAVNSSMGRGAIFPKLPPKALHGIAYRPYIGEHAYPQEAKPTYRPEYIGISG